MAGRLTVRAAGPADVPILARLLAAFQDDARRFDPHLEAGEAVGTRATVDAMLSEGARAEGLVLLAERDGDAIGFASCMLADDDGVSLQPGWRKALEINDLFVVPEARRDGVAAAMIVRILAHAREHGCRRVIVTAYAGNAEAATAYRSLGFGDHQVTLEKVLET